MPGIVLVALEGRKVYFHSKAWSVVWQQITILQGDGVVHDAAPVRRVIRTVLENQKVLGAHGKVEVDRIGHRSARVVRRDHHVLGFGHSSDLLHLPQTAHDADVGLNDVGRLVRQQVAELELVKSASPVAIGIGDLLRR